MRVHNKSVIQTKKVLTAIYVHFI